MLDSEFVAQYPRIREIVVIERQPLLRKDSPRDLPCACHRVGKGAARVEGSIGPDTIMGCRILLRIQSVA